MSDVIITAEAEKQPSRLVTAFSSDLTRNIAAILAVLMAGAALIVTSWTQQSLLQSQQAFQAQLTEAQSRFEHDRAANTAWERYMEAAVANPKMAAAVVPFTGNINNPDDVAYGWFSERMLMAAEQAIFYDPKDEQWTDAFRYEVFRHRRYFLSDMFLTEQFRVMPSYCTWTKNVRAMIRSSFDKAILADVAAIDRLNVAEENCQAIFKKRKIVDA